MAATRTLTHSEGLAMRQIALDLACKASDYEGPEGVTTRAAEYLRFLTTGKRPSKKKPVQPGYDPSAPLTLKNNGSAE